MSGVIAERTRVPPFRLRTEDGETFTHEDLAGHTTLLVLYPAVFSEVCTDQLLLYEEALEEVRAEGLRVYGVSVDPSASQKAFRESVGASIPQLSDSEPRGETARRLGAYLEPAGVADRALVLVGPDAVVRWSHLADSPGDLPGVNLIFDALGAEVEDRA